MNAKLKELYSLELDCTLEEYRPAVETNFGLSLRAMIGPEDHPGAESFDILVCTPEWIKSEYQEEKCVWGLHMLIVLEYDLELIKRQIVNYIHRSSGKDWPTIAQRLSRIGAWEFEDY